MQHRRSGLAEQFDMLEQEVRVRMWSKSLAETLP